MIYNFSYIMSLQKKQVLKKVLQVLIPYWEMAEWFLLLVTEEWNDEIGEKLYQEILKEIKNINSGAQQEKIKSALEKLKQKSDETTKADENEAEQILDDFINNI